MLQKIEIHELAVDYSRSWGKWPTTSDTDYSAIHDAPSINGFRTNKYEVKIITHWYSIYSPFPRLGYKRLPHKALDWQIDIRTRPPPDFLALQLQDLKDYATYCKVIRWRHAYECHPEVSSQLPDLFPLRILEFGDDCPDSSEYKSFPHAANFNALLHNMFTFDYQTGALVSDEYKKRGMAYTQFVCIPRSSGLINYILESNFDLEQKAASIAAGNKTELGLILLCGAAYNMERRKFCGGLWNDKQKLEAAGISSLMRGHNWPEGLLLPTQHPLGSGYTVAPYYCKTLLGPNIQNSSIFNARLTDLWLTGVVQIICDKNDELAHFGIEAEKDYIPFDGSAAGCIDTAIAWFSRKRELAQIMHNGAVTAQRMVATHGPAAAYQKLYEDHLELLI